MFQNDKFKDDFFKDLYLTKRNTFRRIDPSDTPVEKAFIKELKRLTNYQEKKQS